MPSVGTGEYVVQTAITKDCKGKSGRTFWIEFLCDGTAMYGFSNEKSADMAALRYLARYGPRDLRTKAFEELTQLLEDEQ
jgi:hypothetical protein